MSSHLRYIYFLILVFMLTACVGRSGPVPYYSPGGAGWKMCKDLHPVYAYLQGCRTSDWLTEPAPVTPDNANNKVYNSCLLELAANYGNLNVFRQLLRNGADAHQCAPGYAGRFYKVWVQNHCDYPKGSTEEFFLLLESLRIAVPDKQELLKTAASNGCAFAVRFLAARNVNLNFEYEDGLRPLHYVVNAATEEKIETARTLVELGANPQVRSRDGESAIERGRRILSGRASYWPRMEAALMTSTGNAQPSAPGDARKSGARP